MMKERLTFNYPAIRRFYQRVLWRALMLSEGNLLDIYYKKKLVLPSNAVAPVNLSTELLQLMHMNILLATAK